MNACAEQTAFMDGFETLWNTHHASNVVAYVNAHVRTNQTVEVFATRALVSVYLEKWGRGATNHLAHAITLAQTNTLYSTTQRAVVITQLDEMKGLFATLSDSANEPAESRPTWDTQHHALIFNEFADEAPFIFIIKQMNEPEP